MNNRLDLSSRSHWHGSGTVQSSTSWRLLYWTVGMNMATPHSTLLHGTTARVPSNGYWRKEPTLWVLSVTLHNCKSQAAIKNLKIGFRIHVLRILIQVWNCSKNFLEACYVTYLFSIIFFTMIRLPQCKPNTSACEISCAGCCERRRSVTTLLGCKTWEMGYIPWNNRGIALF